MNQKSDFKTTTAKAVWIATALLHMENRNRTDFLAHEIFQKVKDLDITSSSDATLRTHISHHCVANLPPLPNKDRKLYRENGRYRLFKAGDIAHPERQGGQTAPTLEEIPPQFRNTLQWYLTDYYNKVTNASDNTNSESEIFYSEVKENNVAVIPEGVMKMLKAKRGEPLLFLYTKDGRIEIRKPQT